VVRAYAPHPSATQLASAGSAYPAAALRPYLELTVPQSSFTAPQQVAFAPFVTHVAPENVSDQPTGSGLEVLANSPYASAAALARSLASRSATPYAYVLAVERYLSSSPFSYNESPPQTPYPLATFLTSEKLGYCQQFAGGMALMLRMGGIPARVATGFTTGTYDTSAKQWVVSDWDAHAWVEAWFPRYGWVPFDPTPSAAPARGGRTPIAPFHDVGGATGGLRRGGARRDSAATAAGVGAARRHGGSSAPVVIGVTAALLGVLALGLWLTRAPEEPSAELLLAELERALARSGRPLAGGATLASLEQRFRSAPGAAAYIRALRLARFRGDQELPSLRQRRALRSELRAGLGLDGMFRAIWALPPRWGPHWPRRRGS
jgi:hypothetical protein